MRLKGVCLQNHLHHYGAYLERVPWPVGKHAELVEPFESCSLTSLCRNLTAIMCLRVLLLCYSQVLNLLGKYDGN